MGGSRYRTRDRSRETEDAVAVFLATRGWPDAIRVGANLPGPDTLRTPGLRIEVKARRDLRLTTWLEQAGPHTIGGYLPAELPIVVHRPDGYGPAKVHLWPATLRLADLVELLRVAGYSGSTTPQGESV